MKINRVILSGALLVLTLLAYLPALRGPFLWDDATYITRNPLVTEPGGLPRLWFSADTKDYYPLTFTVLRAQWRLWGDNPWGYHLINIALHAANALLLWRLLEKLRLPGAWLAALLFALHPVNVATVAWISELKNLLPFLFATLAALAYLRHEEEPTGRWYAAALALFALSLLGKPIMAPLPVVLLGFAWWQRGRLTARDGWRVAPFFGLALAFGLVTLWCQHYRILEGASARPEGFAARLATAGWAVWFYLWKTIAPVNLCLIYPRWTVNPAALWVYLPALALLAAMIASWRRRALFFAGGVYVVMLLPLLGFLDSGFFPFSLVADHWQYPAIAAALAAIASVLHRRRLPATVVVIALGALCWQRAWVYADAERLWSETLAKNPAAWVAHFNLGLALADKGDRTGAVAHYREALRLNPDYVEAHNNLGNAISRAGHQTEAIAHFEAARRLKPGLAATHNNLGVAYARQGNLAAAAASFREALRCDPAHADARVNLAQALRASAPATPPATP